MLKLLIVAKHSKYEWERKSLNLSHDELINKYESEHANLDAILKSHEKQLYVRDLINSIMSEAKMIMMDAISNEAQSYDMVIVLGGDNAFTNISHYVRSTPILGINSDPDRSTGMLLDRVLKDEDSAHSLLNSINSGEFKIEEWPRLEALLDGKILTPATSEYYFGERQRNQMSRHIMIHRGKESEIKCSGAIFATGAGSTGWLQSARGFASPIPPTSKHGLYINTEVYSYTSRDLLNHSSFGKDERIILYSLNDSDGLVSIDSWEEHSFPRGSKAEIYFGDPLNVVKINKS